MMLFKEIASYKNTKSKELKIGDIYYWYVIKSFKTIYNYNLISAYCYDIIGEAVILLLFVKIKEIWFMKSIPDENLLIDEIKKLPFQILMDIE